MHLLWPPCPRTFHSRIRSFHYVPASERRVDIAAWIGGVRQHVDGA